MDIHSDIWYCVAWRKESRMHSERPEGFRIFGRVLWGGQTGFRNTAAVFWKSTWSNQNDQDGLPPADQKLASSDPDQSEPTKDQW